MSQFQTPLIQEIPEADFAARITGSWLEQLGGVGLLRKFSSYCESGFELECLAGATISPSGIGTPAMAAGTHSFERGRIELKRFGVQSLHGKLEPIAVFDLRERTSESVYDSTIDGVRTTGAAHSQPLPDRRFNLYVDGIRSAKIITDSYCQALVMRDRFFYDIVLADRELNREQVEKLINLQR